MFFLIDWIERKARETKKELLPVSDKKQNDLPEENKKEGRHPKLWVQYWDYDN